MKKIKFLAAIFFLLSGCETIKPLKIQNPRHQFFYYDSDREKTIEKVIDFFSEKNFEIKTMGYHTIVTEDKTYTTSVVSQKNKDFSNAYFISNCTRFGCPIVKFILTIQVTNSKVTVHYNSIKTTPDSYSATPSCLLVEELEDFLKN